MPSVGILIWIWRFLFGNSTSCAREGCHSRKDPRCAGGNCSQCCKSVLACNGCCIVRYDLQSREELIQGICDRIAKAGHRLEYTGFFLIQCTRCSMNEKMVFESVETVEKCLHKFSHHNCNEEQVRRIMDS